MASLPDAMSQVSRSQTSSPTRTAFILLIARGFSAAAMAISTLLMAWVMPAEDVGTVLTLVSAAMLASTPVSLNVEAGAMRFVVSANHDGRNEVIHGFIHLSRRVIAVLSVPVILVFAAVLSVASQADLSVVGLVISAVLIPLFALTRSTARLAGALQQVLRGGFPQLVLRPVIVVLGLGFAALTLENLTVETVLLFFLAGTALTAMVQKMLLGRVLAPIARAKTDDTNAQEWIRHGLRMTPSMLFQDLLRDMILVLAALGLAGENTGVLGVCLAIILVPNLALIAIEMAFGPQISAAQTVGHNARLSALLRQSALLRLLSVVPVVLVIQMAAAPLLEIFGEEYQSGETALRILCLIPLTKALFGNPILILNVAGNAARILRETGLGLVVLLIVLPISSYLFGLTGAALAASFGYAFTQFRLYTSCVRSGLADPSALALRFPAVSSANE